MTIFERFLVKTLVSISLAYLFCQTLSLFLKGNFNDIKPAIATATIITGVTALKEKQS